MKDFTLVLEDDDRDEKELSEQDDAAGERGGEGGEKQSKVLPALKLRSIAISSSSFLV